MNAMAETAAALPDSITSIGEQLDAGGDIAPPPELFQDRGVFAAEYARLFLRPWMAVEHASRLDADGRYFRFEVATRSVVVVRETGERVHALRNACLHAGYRVCEAEEGRLDHLHCVYHDWEYALDGDLTYPALTRRHDAARYRLARYPLRVKAGLVLVDLSRENADSEAEEPEIPAWLGEAVVTARARATAERNWKDLLPRLRSDPAPLLGGPPELPLVEFGALGFLAVRGGCAALVRVVPRAPEKTDLEAIRLALPQVAPAGEDGAAEGLRLAAEAVAAAPPAPLGREFFAWYWSMMA